MKEIDQELGGNPTFVAVNIGYNSSLTELKSFSKSENYKWKVGKASKDMLKAFGVTIQSTKIAIDRTGTIVYREGYGRGTPEEWLSTIKDMENQLN